MNRIRVERCIAGGTPGAWIYGPGWIVLDDTAYCIHDTHDEAMRCALDRAAKLTEATA